MCTAKTRAEPRAELERRGSPSSAPITIRGLTSFPWTLRHSHISDGFGEKIARRGDESPAAAPALRRSAALRPCQSIEPRRREKVGPPRGAAGERLLVLAPDALLKTLVHM